ncbi:MAG: hypothetical protein J6Z40_00400 [Oscillospiraceae bacterium]|nr:hypothetical protein [Oscillospiraceae bacterium]
MMQYGYPYYTPVNSIYQQPAPMPQMQAQQQPVQQQIRSGGIVSVSGEDEARRYPVAPGYTVTMRDETGPYLYEKTMGFSQLDQPIFRKARIVFEDAQESVQNNAGKPEAPAVVYAELSQLEALRDAVAADLNALRSMVETMAEQKKPASRKKEADPE